ncbi:TPA: hypothetical protein KLD70_002482 [Legionella pneumophila]|nr:hypothetical protein [Legionella pneumophila]
MKPTLFLVLMWICAESFGATIMVKGLPSPLGYSNDLYYWPPNVAISPDTTNLFITMDGINKVCFLNTGLQGGLEQISEISIINGVKKDWNCFPYTTTILEARP